MKIRKRLWPVTLLAALLAFSGAEAFGRGGFGGGGRGGGLGGGRGGMGGPGGPGFGGGGNSMNGGTQSREEEERRRREERLKRVAEARIEYAKRERQEIWDAEADARARGALGRVLRSTSE
jgi:hypothetical protein